MAKSGTELDYNELLNRSPIEIDLNGIKSKLTGKRILVTGGCGSIGSEIIRQLIKLNTTTIIVYDNAESQMFYLEQEFLKNSIPSHIRYVIGDIRDRDRLDEVFNSFQPHIVFHAAAYKHVPMMEKNPLEAIKTNIIGTINVADISDKYSVEKFVMVSTDKAVNPTNIMGATKRISEIYTQYLNERSKTAYITTRFGNVLGSQGSVIPTFISQIEDGGPIKLTHPDVTRFFMTIPEACQLVLQAGSIGVGGEIFLFEMGKSVKIKDLAINLMRLIGKDVEIEIIGLRPGEKLYEELLCTGENVIPTSDSNIMKLKHTKMDFTEFISLIEKLIKIKTNNFSRIISTIKDILPEFNMK